MEKEGSVRLVGGEQPHEGLVEVFLLGQWRSLCKPQFIYNLNWTLANATSVCQELGYPAAVAALSRAIYAFQKGTVPTSFVNVADCSIGNELNFTKCSRNLRSGFCSDREAVGAICAGRLYGCIPNNNVINFSDCLFGYIFREFHYIAHTFAVISVLLTQIIAIV